MLSVLLIMLFALPLSAMDKPLDQKKRAISNILEVRCLGNDAIVVHTSVRKKDTRRDNILLYSFFPVKKIHTIFSGKKDLKLLSVNSQHKKCVFSIIDLANPALEKINVYDVGIKKIKSISVNICSRGAQFINKSGDMIVYDVDRSSGAYVFDEQLTLKQIMVNSFNEEFREIYDYQFQDDMIMSYCYGKQAIYYGLAKEIDQNMACDSFFTQIKAKMNSSITSVVRAPLLIFFCKNKASNIIDMNKKIVKKVHDCNQIWLFDLIERTNTSIDHPDFITALEIHPNKKVFVTLSSLGHISYIDIAQKKCIYGPEEVNKKNKNKLLFSECQLNQESDLLSFTENGKFLAIALKDSFFIKKVPFEALYGIDYKRLMYIICVLKGIDAHMVKDIRQLITFRIVQPYL